MHVSFAAQLPPEPGRRGPAGRARPGRPQRPGGYPDAAGRRRRGRGAVTSWTIPVIRDEAEADSGEYSVGAFAPSWDEAPSPAPTQSFPAGMFGQGAAAGRAGPGARPVPPQSERARHRAVGDAVRRPEAGEAVPWLPAHAPAADAAWPA